MACSPRTPDFCSTAGVGDAVGLEAIAAAKLILALPPSSGSAGAQLSDLDRITHISGLYIGAGKMIKRADLWTAGPDCLVPPGWRRLSRSLASGLANLKWTFLVAEVD